MCYYLWSRVGYYDHGKGFQLIVEKKTNFSAPLSRRTELRFNMHNQLKSLFMEASTYQISIVNTVAVDGLATQGARASAGMVDIAYMK